MDRRTYIALTATMAVPLTGCLGSDPVFDELLQEGESGTFDAEAGDELEVTVASGEDGVTASVEPPTDDGWEWTLDEDEETSETIEITEDGEHTVSVSAGSAFITVE